MKKVTLLYTLVCGLTFIVATFNSYYMKMLEKIKL